MFEYSGRNGHDFINISSNTETPFENREEALSLLMIM